MNYNEFISLNREAIELTNKCKKVFEAQGWADDRFPIVNKVRKLAESNLKLSMADLKKKQEELGDSKFKFWIKGIIKDISSLKERYSAWSKIPEPKNKESLRESVLELSGVLEEGIKMLKNSKEVKKNLEKLKIKTYALKMNFSKEQKDFLKKTINIMEKGVSELEDLEDKYANSKDKKEKKEFKAEYKKLVAKYKKEYSKAYSVNKIESVLRSFSGGDAAIILLCSALIGGFLGITTTLVASNIYHKNIVDPKRLKNAEEIRKSEDDEEDEIPEKESLRESVLELTGLTV
jgi:ABC-type antimicrobial peptide transport system permease subunit